MKSSHTPGPWTVDRNWPFEDGQGRRFDAVIKHCQNGDALVCSFEHSVFRDEHKQNARLIAAAPELLEACKVARTTLARLIMEAVTDADDDKTLALLNSAIEKANA